MLQNLISLRLFRLTKWSFFVDSTPNAPYVHPRLYLILKLCGAFLKVNCHVENCFSVIDLINACPFISAP